MAINIPIITEFADAGLKSAQGAFNQFKTKVGEANGAMGKFKAGSSVAFDSIKANAGKMALGAGASIAGFAMKAIGDFKDLALSVDEFRNKTGLTLKQSSEWVSYTGDLGIQADSISKIFTRLSKAATDQIPAFRQLGVAVAFGEDGAPDIEKTFFRVNDAINSLNDPIKQAAYRADLFGRGWQDAAELINMSSTEIKTSLAGVKDFEVIDEEEIRKAKDLRAAQDELGDAFLRLSVSLGEALIPGLTALSKVLIPVLEALAKFNGTLDEGMAGAIQKAQEMGHSLSDIARELGVNGEQSLRYMADVLGISLDKLYEQLDRDLIPETYLMERAWREGSRAMVDAYKQANGLEDGLQGVTTATSDLDAEWQRFLGTLSRQDAWNNLQDRLERTKEAAYDAFVNGTAASARKAQSAQNDLIREIGKYIDQLGNIPPEVQTRIIGQLERGAFDEAIGLLNALRQGVNVPITGTVSGIPVGPGETPSEVRPPGTSPRPPQIRPPAKIPSGIIRIPALPPSMRSGVTVNVAGSVISEGQLVETVRKGLVNSQRNGAGLVYSNR